MEEKINGTEAGKKAGGRQEGNWDYLSKSEGRSHSVGTTRKK